MTHDAPTRSDLDAAIDAVVPSLTAVSDDAVADSLRRTRVALGDEVPRLRNGSAAAWRWGLAAASGTAILALAMGLLWRGSVGPVTPPAVATRPAAGIVASAPAPVPPTTPLAATTGSAPSTKQTRRVRTPGQAPVAATSTPLAEPVRRPDPLIALVRAVQTIPEDAWTRGTTANDFATPDVVIAPIAIAPLETPAMTDPPAEPIAPGEP